MLKDFNRIYAISIDINKLEVEYNSGALYSSADRGTSTLSIQIKKNGIIMDLNGCTIDAIFECADKETYSQRAILLDGEVGAIALDLKTDVLVEGVNKFRLKIRNEEDIMISPCVSYKVTKGLDDAIDATDTRVPLLIELMTRVEDIETVEEKRKKDETTRITNEETRVSNENTRVTNEDVRIASEIDRVSNENTRITNEDSRVSAETDRQGRYETLMSDAENAVDNFNIYTTKANQDEETRKSTELERNKFEVERKSNESDRISNENTRKVNENLRIEAEKRRESKHSQNILEVNEKIKDVNMAIGAGTKDLEVKEARRDASGVEHVTLKDRLDSDLIKGKVHYETVEGSNITTDTTDGYAKKLEILGNTTQGTNLSDIRSTGDKVEGQKLYSIPLLSVGKNMLPPYELEKGSISSSGNPYVDDTYVRSKDFVPCIMGLSKEYRFSTSILYRICFYDKDKNFISVGARDFQIPKGTKYIKFALNSTNLSFQAWIEEGTQTTSYEPYQSDELTILSPVQLEKVGDISDRIICKDGVWGVEKNIITRVLNGVDELKDGTTWKEASKTDTTRRFYLYPFNEKVNGFNIMSSMVVVDNNIDSSIGVSGYMTDGRIYIKQLDTIVTGSIIDWLKINNVLVKYPTTTPQFIPLPHDQQVKLRTFANRTNISFGCEVEGTIKADVPKSIGASVNSNTKAIQDINKDLERVKKLEEATTSTVTTESNFTKIEETTSGYFEGVKLEGRTLVNLMPKARWSNISSGANCVYGHVPTFNKLPFKPNTVYTSVLINTPDNFGSQWMYTLAKEGRVNSAIAKFTTLDDISQSNSYLHIYPVGRNFTQEEVDKIEVVILEGDHTQNPPQYFEGMKSVGDKTDEIVVSSCNENLYQGTPYIGGTNNDTIMLNDISMKLEGKYSLVFDTLTQYKGNSVYIKSTTAKYSRIIGGINTVNNIAKSTLTMNYEDINILKDNKDAHLEIYRGGEVPHIPTKVMLNYGELALNYIESKQDKKQLLFLDTADNTWKKPILREWDSVEKNSDGKYYYHQKSVEYTLNGIDTINEVVDNTNTTLAKFNIQSIKAKSNSTGVVNILCDIVNPSQGSADIPHVRLDGTTPYGNLNIWFDKSWGITKDSINAKLKTTPVTIVCPLAEEKVYECTPIDLISFENETNYMVESGVLSPKSTIKVQNNISNVITNLQKKVSILEDKFTFGLKQVLAGDMQSLAYTLYPEDFEK